MYYHILVDDFECDGFTRLYTFVDHKSASNTFVELWSRERDIYVDVDDVQGMIGSTELNIFDSEPYGVYGKSYGSFWSGSLCYWLVASDYSADQLDFLCKRNNMWDDTPDREISLKPEWDHTPGEGYDVGTVPKSSRLKYPKQVSELKIAMMEKKFVMFGREELRLRKQYARRASRRQSKKMVRDFL